MNDAQPRRRPAPDPDLVLHYPRRPPLYAVILDRGLSIALALAAAAGVAWVIGQACALLAWAFEVFGI